MAAAIISWLGGAARAQPLELKVSHYLPPNHTVQKVLEDWAQALDTRSAGRLKLRIYPASQLGPVQRQCNLARNGQADSAVGLTGATPGRSPLTEVAALPFVHPPEGTASAITSRRMTALAPKSLTRDYPGLHVLWVGVTPLSTFITGSREIATLTDLRGLKMCVQGEQHAKVLRALGAVPLQVPPGEIADGMAKGVIGGAVFNFEAAESFGFGSVTQHGMEPNFLGGTLVLVMNAARYDGLPPELRAMIDETTGPDGAAALGARWNEADRHGQDYLVTSKVAFVTLAPAELTKSQDTLGVLTSGAVSALDKDGKPGSQLLTDYAK